MEGPHTHPEASGQLCPAPYLCLWPQPCTHVHIMSRGELGKAESCRDLEAARGSPQLPEAHYGPKCKPLGVTMYPRLAEAITFLRTMPDIP